MHNEFIELLNNRRTVRKYDPTIKITHEEMSEILTTAMWAPSSMNLQPTRFVVVESTEAKELVAPFVTYNPIQHKTSAATIVILSDLESYRHSEEIVAHYTHLSETEKAETVAKYISRMENAGKDKRHDVALFDAGLITMQLMLTAKAYGYDTCAIGGFDKEGLVKALGYDVNRYEPALLLTIGKADEQPRPTARLAVDAIAEWK